MHDDDTSTASPRPAGPSRALLLGLLALALAAVYGTAALGDFVYDDVRLIQNNPRLTSWEGLQLSLRTPHWSFDEPVAAGQLGHWRPLTVGVLALGQWITPKAVLGHHLVSLLLHLAASLAVARLIRTLGAGGGWCLAGALLFALHPVQVEAVAWASAVNDPLFALFAILGLDAWIGWRQGGSRGLPWKTTAFWALSLAAKEQALVLPILLVGYDLIAHLLRSDGQERQEELPLLRSYVGLAVVAAIYLGLRMWVFESWKAGFDRQSVDFPLGGLRELTYRVELLGGFLSLLAWPADLAVFRGFRPQLPEGDATLLIAGAWIAAYLVLAAAVFWRGRPVTKALVILVPLALAPQLGPLEKVGSYPLSDRYLYLSVALMVPLVVAAARQWLPARVGPWAVGLLAVAGGARGYLHADTFRDNDRFSLAAIESSPRVPAVHWQRGNLLLQGFQVDNKPEQVQAAFLHYLESLALGTEYVGAARPAADTPLDERVAALQSMVMDTPADRRKPDPTVFVSAFDRLNANLGQGFCFLYLADISSDHDLTMAQTVFDEVSRLFPNSDLARLGQGLTYRARGRLAEAEVALGQAANLNKLNPDAWYELGNCFLLQEKWAAARNAFQRALHLRPLSVRDRVAIVRAALEEGQFEVAALRLEEARELEPASLEVLYWSGMLAARERNFPDALAWFERALAVDERFGNAHLEKATVLLHLQENQAAVRSLGRACELMPRNFQAHYNLGSLLDQAAEPEGARPYLVQAYGLSEPGDLRDRLHLRLAQMLGNDPEGTLNMARVAEANRDPEAALDWVERAIERSEPMSRNPRAHHLRGRYLQQMNRHAEAAGALKESLRHDEASFWPQHDLALLLAHRLGRQGEAEPHLRRALELLPKVALESESLRGTITENLTATLEGRRPEMGPTLEPLQAEGVKPR